MPIRLSCWLPALVANVADVLGLADQFGILWKKVTGVVSKVVDETHDAVVVDEINDTVVVDEAVGH
jgi:hypothetical protein